MTVLQRLLTVAIGRRMCADCHEAVAKLGDRGRQDGQVSGVQLPYDSRVILDAAPLTALLLLELIPTTLSYLGRQPNQRP